METYARKVTSTKESECRGLVANLFEQGIQY
jgi:hypothetical protein